MFRFVSNFIYKMYNKLRNWWSPPPPSFETRMLKYTKEPLREWDGREAKRFYEYKRTSYIN